MTLPTPCTSSLAEGRRGGAAEMSRREVIATLRLFLACSAGDIAGVESALRLKASPNARSEEGLTPVLATVWAWAGAPIPVIRKVSARNYDRSYTCVPAARPGPNPPQIYHSSNLPSASW